MSNIVIDKWYGKEKTDLINKNTISKVEFIEQSTAPVGGTVYSQQLWLWENVTEQDFLDAGFSSVTMRGNTGSSENTAWGDKVETKDVETLGDTTITFPNQYGDTSAANYSVSIKCCYRRNGTTTFYTYEFLKGSMVTPSTEESTAISGQIGIAFSGNNIVLSLTNMLLYGDYYVTSYVFPEASQQRNLRPWYYGITVVYGGLKTEEEKVAYGTGDKSLSFEKNSLIEAHTMVGENKLSADIANTILQNYESGRQTVAIKILCSKFYDEDGNLTFDIDSEDNAIPHLIRIGDVFTLKKRGQFLYTKANGDRRYFIVTKANLRYSGKPIMDIEGVEVFE